MLEIRIVHEKTRILCGFRYDIVFTAVYSQAKQAPEGPPRLSYSQGLFKAFYGPFAAFVA